MQTLITKTSSKGHAIEIVIKDHSLYGYVNGETAGEDSVETYSDYAQVGDVTIAGYLRKSKIALTPDELRSVKAQVKAEQAARLTAQRRTMRAPINRNQPSDLGYEMDREDSAF